MNSEKTIVLPSAEPDTQRDLQTLGSSFQHAVAKTRDKADLILQQVEEIREKQNHWLGRLTLSNSEKETIAIYQQRQQEAIEIILGEQNKSMQAVAETHVRFVQEVANSILLTGRSGMQAAIQAIYRQNGLQLLQKLQHIDVGFWDLMEQKIADAQKRPEKFREVIEQQVQISITEWNKQYEQILQEFSALLKDKV
jgi:hypothetical protein